jgi:hypothetical protein
MSDAFDRVSALEREVRVQLHQLNREVATERAITRDLIEAMHKRFDSLESSVLNELRIIRSAVTGNGHG